LSLAQTNYRHFKYFFYDNVAVFQLLVAREISMLRGFFVFNYGIIS